MEAVSIHLAFPALAPKPISNSIAPPGPASSPVGDTVAIATKCICDICCRPAVRDFLTGLVVLLVILWFRGGITLGFGRQRHIIPGYSQYWY